MDRGAWWAIGHEVTKSWISRYTHIHTHTHTHTPATDSENSLVLRYIHIQFTASQRVWHRVDTPGKAAEWKGKILVA